jgi:hypothetical protein
MERKKTDKKAELAEFKEKYEVLQKKYSLPGFKELNELFDIEKVASETEVVLRDIRKAIIDKVLAYFRFIEGLLNPASSGSMFLMFLTKYLSADDKKTAEKLYSKFGEIEIEIMALDNRYSENAEAEFIKKINKEWKDIQDDVDKLIKSFKKGMNNKSEKKERDYFA